MTVNRLDKTARWPLASDLVRAGDGSGLLLSLGHLLLLGDGLGLWFWSEGQKSKDKVT